MENRTTAPIIAHLPFSHGRLLLVGGGFALLTGALSALFGIAGFAFGIGTAVAVLLSLAIFKNPWFGLLVITLVLPLERFGSLEVAGLTLRTSQVFGFLTLLSFLGAGLVRRKLSFRPYPGVVFLFLFLGAALLSLAGAPNLFRGALTFCFVLFTILVHFLLPNLITDEEKLKRVLRALFVTTGIVTAFGIFQFFGDIIGLPTAVTGLRDLYTSEVFGFPRVQSTFIEPLYFANFLLIPIGLLLSYLFSPHRTERLPFMFLLLGLCGLNLVLTLSRGGYLGLFVTAFAVVLISFRKVFTFKRILLSALLIVLVGWAFLQLFAFTGNEDIFLGRFFRQATNLFSGASFFDRASTYTQAFDLFKQSPWLGLGIGNFGPAIALHPLQQPEGGWLIVNNEFLEILVETGIIGMTLFLAFLSSVFFRSLRVLRQSPDGFLKRTLLGLFAAFLGVLVQYQTFSVLYIMHVWFLIGLLVAVQNLLERRRA
jgi:O-antigen ligase